MKTIKVNNMANFEFWVGMFKQRTQDWQKEALNRLQGEVGKPFTGTIAEREDKIKALLFLIN